MSREKAGGKFDYRTEYVYQTARNLDYMKTDKMVSGSSSYKYRGNKYGQQEQSLSLEGYNLLDQQKNKRLTRTAEYFSRTEKSQTGRYVLLSLKYNFK